MMTALGIGNSAITGLQSTFTSRFQCFKHPKTEDVLLRIREYLLDNWPWPSAESKEKYSRSDMEKGTLFAYPYALDERIEIPTLLFPFLVLVDDILEYMPRDEARKTVKAIIGIASGVIRPNPENKIEVILGELCTRFTSIGDDASQKQAREVLNQMCRWFIEVGNKDARQGASHSFEAFAEYRKEDIGTGMLVSMMCWVNAIYLPTHIAGDLEIQLLTEIVGLHIAMVNDLFSYRVEELRRRIEERSPEIATDTAGMCNSVAVLMKEKDLDAQSAMNEISTFHLPEIEERFMGIANQVAERFTSEDRTIVTRFVRASEAMMAGNCEWSKFCGRYNNV